MRSAGQFQIGARRQRSTPCFSAESARTSAVWSRAVGAADPVGLVGARPAAWPKVDVPDPFTQPWRPQRDTDAGRLTTGWVSGPRERLTTLHAMLRAQTLRNTTRPLPSIGSP